MFARSSDTNSDSSRRRPAAGRTRRRHLDLPWLVGSLVLLALLIPAVYFWHAHQVRRVAAALSTEADRCVAQGNHAQAAQYLYRLLQMQPQEPQRSETLVRLAQTYDRSVDNLQGKPAVIQWYYRAVGAAPQRLDLQMRLGELFLETGQFVLAADQAQRILQQDPALAEAFRLQALAHFGQLRQGRPIGIAQVLQELQQARQSLPGDPAIAQTLASLYREMPPSPELAAAAEQADAVMDSLVKDAAQDYRAHLARFRYRVKYAAQAADADLQRALQLAPEEPEVLWAAAQWAQTREAFQEAVGFYQRLAQVSPSDSRAYLGSGDCQYRLGQVEDAVRTWQAGRDLAGSDRLPLRLRLAGALLELNRVDDAAQELKIANQLIANLPATVEAAQQDAWRASHDLLLAKLALAQQRPQQASALLQRIATTAKLQARQRPEDSVAYQACMLLGQTRLQSQQWEDALQSFQQALQLAPQSAVARLGAAQAYLALGREDQALAISEQVVAGASAPSDFWRVLAQLQLDRQLRLPPTDRQWDTLQQTLQKAQSALPDAWEIPLVQAQLLLARDGLANGGLVLELLQAAEQAHPNVLPLWLNLVFLYEELGRTADADRALQRVQTLAQDPLQARAWQAVVRGLRGHFPEAEQLLTEVDSATPDPSLWLPRARLLLAYQQGVTDDVHNALLSLVQLQPENTQWLAQLAELALSQRKGAEADRWISRLQEVEGPNGVLWKFFQARRLTLRSLSSDSPDLERLRRLMTDIEQARPNWSGMHWLRGLVAELEGQPDVAIEAFSTAIRAGFRQQELWQRLVRLLNRQGRLAEAEQWLIELKQPGSLGGPMNAAAWDTALPAQRLNWAVQRAEEEVTLQPRDAAAQVWLASLLLLVGRNDDAAAALHRAEQLQPRDAATLVGLLAGCLQLGDASAARRLMDQLTEHPDVPSPDRQILLAQTHYALGDLPDARAHYEAAIESAPERVDLQLKYARFLQPFEPDRAEQRLRAVLRRDPQQTAARQLLATWLLWRDDAAARQEAFALLQQASDHPQQRAADLRWQAVLLSRQSSIDSAQRAIELLEVLIADAAHATPEDRLLLASIYELQGQAAQAEQQLLRLVERPQPAPRYLGALIEFLLRQQRPAEAQTWLNQLQQQVPESFVTVSLQARVLQAAGKDEQIEPLVERFAAQWLQSLADPASQQRCIRQLAELYEAVGRTEAARRRLTQLTELFADQCEALASFQMRQGEAQAAIQTCAVPLQQAPTAAAATRLLRVLVQAPPDASVAPPIEALLEQMLREHAEDRGLLFAMSNWRLKQQQLTSAMELLQRLTQIDARHYLAWNNLAALLAEDSARLPEALVAADRALAAAGQPLPNLLDTKAVILLRQERNVEAARLLLQALSLPDAEDPRFYLHLATAQQRLGHIPQAIDSWRRAQELGLQSSFLTASEQEMANRLREKLAADSDQS